MTFRNRLAAIIFNLNDRMQAKLESRRQMGVLPGRVLAHAAMQAPKPENMSHFEGLPSEYRTPEVIALQSEIEGIIFDILPRRPADQDLHMIGLLAQLSASLDQVGQQMRYRLISAGALPQNVSKSGSWMTLASKLIKGVKRLDIEEMERNEVVALIELAQHHLPIRDVAVHWIAKPVNEHDAVMFITKRDRDAAAITGLGMDPHSLHHIVMRREDLLRCARELCDIENALKARLENWHHRKIKAGDSYTYIAPETLNPNSSP